MKVSRWLKLGDAVEIAVEWRCAIERHDGLHRFCEVAKIWCINRAHQRADRRY